MVKKSDKFKLYYVTSPDNLSVIPDEGIRAEADGYIRLFTDRKLALGIAVRLCLRDYALYQVNPKGITVPVEPPKAEAAYQILVRQGQIAPKYVKHLRCYKITGPMLGSG